MLSSTILSRKTPALIFPKGTYRTKPFYFRGQDEYQEQEHHALEYNNLLVEFQSKEAELLVAKQDFSNAESDLQKSQFLVNQMAGNQGEEGELTLQHSYLLQNIQNLEYDIQETEEKIQELSLMNKPNEFERIENERTILFREIEEFIRRLNLKSDVQKLIADAIITDGYQESIKYIFEIEALNRYKSHFRRILNDQRDRKILNASRSTTYTNYDSEVIWFLEEKTEAELQLYDLKFQNRMAKIHKTVSKEAKLSFCDELNSLLVQHEVDPFDLTNLTNCLN